MKASVFIGTSVDGFIARANGDLDFLPPGGGEPHGYDEFMATVDALVIGRKTFETVLSFDEWPYGEKRVFVLSTRPLAAAPPGAVVERMSGPPADIVSQLAARGIQHAYVDGGITIQGFLRAGLIQRLIITRVPVLIGAGIPLFGELQRDIALTHVATRQSHYDALRKSRTIILANMDEYDVFGDGTVVIMAAPGHTPGQQVLVLKLPKTGPVMLSGDLYHFPEERAAQLVPHIESDREQSRASRVKIEEYVKKHGIKMWIEHDTHFYATLKRSPNYIE